ncbi:ABC-three component system middle component 5 [Rhizobium laguerreae]|uniref:ABC-three component system middle component 5 n=1 Tax=Rhizobium laguerreae TaxID=1076926 RepID=UPI0036F42795
MSSYRVWYAARDPYHCIFRMIRLLQAKDGSIPLEQLRILDMYLMYPPLLHRLTLTSGLREKLRGLRIEPPAKSFVKLPGTASVWQDLQLYQLTALKRLAGLGILRREDLLERNAKLDRAQTPANLLEHAATQNEPEKPLLHFLVDDLGALPLSGSEGLTRRAGLPSRGPVT